MENKKESKVYVGTKKGLKEYELYVLDEIDKGVTQITIVARGRAISKAVDLEQKSERRGLELKGIKLGTEEVSSDRTPEGEQEGNDNREKYTFKVSSIEIMMEVKGKK